MVKMVSNSKFTAQKFTIVKHPLNPTLRQNRFPKHYTGVISFNTNASLILELLSEAIVLTVVLPAIRSKFTVHVIMFPYKEVLTATCPLLF